MVRKEGGSLSTVIDALQVRNASLESLLREFCKQTKHRFEVHEEAIILFPLVDQEGKK